ncbi:hypothetical protein mRhiFer1_009267 [Rhinolophus ferrumequinum]|uniref:Uncharacterized protein n=1 Tax=Rhinolophus ferrumequinum TaxID=59479 RepID=A0A7J7S888_RHIFE|nr:hypothetical protein mRhiFer1_009267 [Rhinolophus ferrumequinum]
MIFHLGSFQGVGAGAELQGGGRGSRPGRGAVQRPGGRTMGDEWGPREGPDMGPISSEEVAGTGPHPRMGGKSSPTQESQPGVGGPVLPPPGSLPPFQPQRPTLPTSRTASPLPTVLALLAALLSTPFFPWQRLLQPGAMAPCPMGRCRTAPTDLHHCCTTAAGAVHSDT